MPLETAELAAGCCFEQLCGAAVLLAFPGGLDEVHFRGIERLAQLFLCGQCVVLLPNGSLLARLRQSALVGLGFLGDLFRLDGFQRIAFIFYGHLFRVGRPHRLPGADGDTGNQQNHKSGSDGQRGLVARGRTLDSR